MIPWLALFSSGCGIAPDAEALVGTWFSTDDDASRQLSFGSDRRYEIEVDEAFAQSGTFSVEHGVLLRIDARERTYPDALVWTVEQDAGGVEPGTQFGNAIYRLTETTLVLSSESTDSGRRVWER